MWRQGDRERMVGREKRGGCMVWVEEIWRLGWEGSMKYIRVIVGLGMIWRGRRVMLGVVKGFKARVQGFDAEYEGLA